MKEPKILIEKRGDSVLVETEGSISALTTLFVIAMRRERFIKALIEKALSTFKILKRKEWLTDTQRYQRGMER